MRTADRFRHHTADPIHRQIEQQAQDRIHQHEYSSHNELSQRIYELEHEWDIEGMVATNASLLSLAGVALGALHNKRWLVIPGMVLPFLLQQTIQGWSPPVPLLRRFGVRNRQEIAQEKYALKVLRGDFGFSGTHMAPQSDQPATKGHTTMKGLNS